MVTLFEYRSLFVESIITRVEYLVNTQFEIFLYFFELSKTRNGYIM